MITLRLTRADGQKSVSLRLPASPDEEIRAFAKLDEISDDVGSTRISGITCRIQNLTQYIKSADVSGPDYEKLKRLAEQLNGISERERRIFSGALDAESINGLDDVLRIADHLESYELIEDVICDRDLGGWLVEHDMLGVNFPEAVRPYLDYVSIGAKYYSNHDGAYTLNGYVKRKEVSPQLAAEENSVLRLSLASSKNAFTLGLPASEEQLEAAKRALGVQDFDQVGVHGVEFAPDYQTVTIPTDCMTIDDANWLALCLQQMSSDEIRTYRAALEAEEPGTFTEALDIAVDMYALGKIYLEEDDLPAALRWLQRSAELGNQYAQYTLGKLYLLGKDVPRDKDTAVRWFTLAAEQGNQHAQFFLDHMNDSPSLFASATRLLHHMGNVFEEQAAHPVGGINFVDSKLMRRIREKKIAMGHKPDDHEEQVQQTM